MRVHNFNAGPSALPLAALERARDELVDFAGTGMSIAEHSHRGAAYEAVHEEALGLVRSLLGVPSGYQVLFLQGGASQQFAQVPMNLLRPGASADYVLTGVWSDKALEEARLVGNARVAGGGPEGAPQTRVPRQEELALDPSAAYVHFTTNNTIYGTQWHWMPEPGAVPLVADMSSDIFSRPADVARFGLIYAGAQKNAGAAGVTIVIVRDDLVAGGRTDIPRFFRYSTHAGAGSLFHTPPVLAIYMLRNVLAWLAAQGGVAAIERVNEAKAATLYGALDELSGFYRAPVERESRSRMNVVFRLPSEDLERRFVAEAERAGMVGLKGHRSAGGIRASIYNAVSLASVEALAAFLREFARVHG